VKFKVHINVKRLVPQRNKAKFLSQLSQFTLYNYSSHFNILFVTNSIIKQIRVTILVRGLKKYLVTTVLLTLGQLQFYGFL